MTKLIPTSSIAEAHAPPEAILYAVGDIHGRLDLVSGVTAELKRAAAAAKRGRICAVFLGDYIDRGPAARGVIDHLLAFREAGVVDTVFLRGNHEQLLIDLIDGDAEAVEWLNWGGVETLTAYGVDPRDQPGAGEPEKLIELVRRVVPEAHVAFLRATELFVERGDYLFVHAGLRPDRLLTEQSDADLLWYRYYADDAPLHGKLVIHGHTPRARPLVSRWHIDIDTEAYASGALTAVRLEGDRREFLKFEVSGISAWDKTDEFAERLKHAAKRPRARVVRHGTVETAARRGVAVVSALAVLVALIWLGGTAWRYRDRLLPAPARAPVHSTVHTAAAQPAARLMAVAPAPPPVDPPAMRGPVGDPPPADPPKADPPRADPPKGDPRTLYPPAGGGPRVQVGALPSADEAQQAGERARRAYAANAKTVQVEKVTTAAGATLYRAYLVGFDGDGEASAFCRKLTAAGASCLVRKAAG